MWKTRSSKQQGYLFPRRLSASYSKKDRHLFDIFNKMTEFLILNETNNCISPNMLQTNET